MRRDREIAHRKNGLSCVATGEAGLNPSGYQLSAISYELINYGEIYSNVISIS